MRATYLKPALLLISSLLLGCAKTDPAEFSGYIEGEFAYISSPLTGKLKQLNVTKGQQVRAGTALFTLDPQPETAELQQAQQQNLQAAAAAKLASQRLDRMRRLYAKKHIDKDTLDAAESQYQQAQANAAAAAALVSKTQWAIQQKTVLTTMAGLIYDTYYQPDEVVPAGYPVIALLPPNKVNVIFFVPESHLAQRYLGETVHIACDNCPAYNARIHYISPKAEYTPPVIYSRSNSYKLVYRVKAAPVDMPFEQLHPGQPVFITLK